jgi:hypothetical protein
MGRPVDFQFVQLQFQLIDLLFEFFRSGAELGLPVFLSLKISSFRLLDSGFRFGARSVRCAFRRRCVERMSQLLRDQPEKSIAEIAYENGYEPQNFAGFDRFFAGSDIALKE